MLFAIKSACPDFWQIFGERLFRRRYGSEKSENHRINTADFWWAWVDLNHRPGPYQDSVVRSYKNLQVPRGLPKTAQGRMASAGQLDHRRPAADCPHMAFGLALASSILTGLIV